MTRNCVGCLSVGAPARKVGFSGTSGTAGLPKPPIGRRGALERIAYTSRILVDLYTVPDVRWPCDQLNIQEPTSITIAHCIAVPALLQTLESCGVDAEANHSAVLHSIDPCG